MDLRVNWDASFPWIYHGPCGAWGSCSHRILPHNPRTTLQITRELRVRGKDTYLFAPYSPIEPSWAPLLVRTVSSRIMPYAHVIRQGWVVVFVASYFSSTDVSMSCAQLTIMIARCYDSPALPSQRQRHRTRSRLGCAVGTDQKIWRSKVCDSVRSFVIAVQGGSRGPMPNA